MTDFPAFAGLFTTAGDARFLFALAIAVVAGVVRGFSGFGSALIYMPLISTLYGPRVAAPTLLLIDTICSLPFAIQATPQCNWREVTPVSIGGALALPLGVMALIVVDPLSLRWAISMLVLVALVALVAGWRYHGRPTLAASVGVGALAGFGGGAVQIGAPPLLVFWLGGANSAATVRANIMVFFIMQGTLSCVFYFFNGLFTAEVLTLALLFGLPFALALTAGAFWFHGSSDPLYRRIAYIIIAFAGLASLPLFDALR
ncbi:MAG: TSUP family transporter [Pseudolabrys sp.]